MQCRSPTQQRPLSTPTRLVSLSITLGWGLMKRTSLAGFPCSLARTMDLLGDWWTPLVLREAFYGVRRFDDFARELKLARTTLTDRLNRLVEAELMEKVPYQHAPVRYEYVLTEK